jgi:hypothetical protein
MEKIRLNKTENITEKDILNICEETKRILLETLKAEKSDYWEKIIMAGEMASLGINVLDNLSEEEKEKMREKLEKVRTELKENKDKKNYIDLARGIYRFKNIGLDYPELTNEEKEILENLPMLFRQDKEWHGHLNYIPQIAKALNKSADEISSKEDHELARKFLEEKLKEGGEEELMNMIFTGLLVELDEDETEKLLKSENWHEDRWQEVLKMIEEAKNNEQGYFLLRHLQPLRKLVEFRKNIKN